MNTLMTHISPAVQHRCTWWCLYTQTGCFSVTSVMSLPLLLSAVLTLHPFILKDPSITRSLAVLQRGAGEVHVQGPLTTASTSIVICFTQTLIQCSDYFHCWLDGTVFRPPITSPRIFIQTARRSGGAVLPL